MRPTTTNSDAPSHSAPNEALRDLARLLARVAAAERNSSPTDGLADAPEDHADCSPDALDPDGPQPADR